MARVTRPSLVQTAVLEGYYYRSLSDLIDDLDTELSDEWEIYSRHRVKITIEFEEDD